MPKIARVLVLVVETDSVSWLQHEKGRGESKLNFESLSRALTVFSNAFILNRENRLVVIARDRYRANVIYPVNGLANAPVPHELSSALLGGLYRSVTNLTDSSSSSSGLVQALSKALCVLNRYVKLNFTPHIVVVELGKDSSVTYNAVMNSIFSAQKLGVLIDALILSNEDSSFFQQACYLTGGLYLRPVDQRDALQLMLSYFLPSASTRSCLALPTLRSVDFRAACFCHGKSIEFAYMCTVCLTLLCEPEKTACRVCGSTIRGKG